MTSPSLRRGAIPALLIMLLAGPLTSSTASAQELEWEEGWRRVGWPEAAIIAASAGGTYLVKANFDAIASARWQGGVLVDDLVLGLLAAEEEGSRDLSSALSDYALLSLMAYPSLVDPVAAAWIGHGSRDVAFQTSVISTEFLAANFFVASLAKALVGRLRPRHGHCDDRGSTDPLAPVCPDPVIGSFFSSHASLAFTAAGLVCTHHHSLPLYGGGTWDDVACFGSLGLATTTAALRLVSHSHYLSDVLVGALVGAVSGMVLPRLVYYGDSDESRGETASDPLVSPPAPALLNLRIPLP